MKMSEKIEEIKLIKCSSFCIASFNKHESSKRQLCSKSKIILSGCLMIISILFSESDIKL